MSEQLRAVLTMALIAVEQANYYAAEAYLRRCVSQANKDKNSKVKSCVFRALVAVRRKI